MRAGHWTMYVLAALGALVAAFSVLPYEWAHLAATAVGAAQLAFAGSAGVIIQRTK